MDVSFVKKNGGHCLGTGARGAVYQGFNEQSGQLVAIKEIPIPTQTSDSTTSSSGSSSSSLLEEIANEIDLMKQLHHPHLVQYYGVRRSPPEDNNGSHIQIILEYVSGGSLGAIIKKYGKLREAVARQYTRDIFSALSYLHTKCHVCHRDIKPENILLSPEGKCKLADFGASKILCDNASLLKSCVGTPWYMAPEVIQGVGYHTAADIWSAGCTIFEMLTGKPPFHDMSNPMAVMFKVASQDDLAPVLPEDVHVSDECKAFLALCFDRNVNSRASALDSLKHPWLDGMKVGHTNQQPQHQSSSLAATKRSAASGADSVTDGHQHEEDGDGDDVLTQHDTEDGGDANVSASLSPSATPRKQQQPQHQTEEAPAEEKPTEEVDFFPGKSKGDEFDFTRICHKCNKNIAVFSCDQCRMLQAPHQVCPQCWETIHAHPRAASHIRGPLLLPAEGVPAPEKAKKAPYKGKVVGVGGTNSGGAPTTPTAAPQSPFVQNLQAPGFGGGPSMTPLGSGLSPFSSNIINSSGSYSARPQSQAGGPIPSATTNCAAAIAATSAAGILLANGDFVDMYTGEQSEWECGRCTYLNDGPAPECAMCGYER